MKSVQANKDKQVVVTVEGLYKSFDDNHVLKGVDLELSKGENIVVLGRSGSGKSVLIKIIAVLIKPDKGKVNVLGKDVHQLKKQELNEIRLKIGFLFQHSALYDSMTVRENLEFPLRRNVAEISQREMDEAVENVLGAVGMTEAINQFPSELSGGEEKRIAIARMLILKPQIIFYDEPTSGLDPLTSVEINNLISRVKEHYEASAIVITHDLTCAKQTGDRIMMLMDGKFVREGSFDHVFDTNDEQIRGFYDYNFVQ